MRTDYDVHFVDAPIGLSLLRDLAETRFGELVKAVVDVRRGVMAVSGDLHADEEQLLLASGSAQADLWGINLYPARYDHVGWLEFDSMINLRPPTNRSRDVEDPTVREAVGRIVTSLVDADA